MLRSFPCTGATVLRLVVLETTAACVQLAQDWTAADVSLPVLDPSQPVQVRALLAGTCNQGSCCLFNWWPGVGLAVE